MLHWYKPPDTENFICDLYQAFGINYPGEMDLDLISTIWGVDIQFYDGRPFTQWDDEGAVIMLTKGSREQDIRATFFHELCHPAKHAGNQDELPHLFRELQEIQAGHFQLISAMPYYLLPEPVPLWEEYARIIAETFKVPYELAERRVDHIISRMGQEYLYLRKYIPQWRVYA
ncbi:ImmA/IrrE family metallo-endopeptidase [Cohnella abietis]|uniref:IrrE N-terminal-like domain-containing protein n=1 Tax=Cohnella abietis TaxID=2507935 RepID=A0A3T1D1L8_9BACL|nr:ImmA/IrrE family metallo-endopeptidase [Cohnella abietis]BBI32007.1 hypothetical protein KCTCHS21_14060 [Cohnella abietis]